MQKNKCCYCNFLSFTDWWFKINVLTKHSILMQSPLMYLIAICIEPQNSICKKLSGVLQHALVTLFHYNILFVSFPIFAPASLKTIVYIPLPQWIRNLRDSMSFFQTLSHFAPSSLPKHFTTTEWKTFNFVVITLESFGVN